MPFKNKYPIPIHGEYWEISYKNEFRRTNNEYKAKKFADQMEKYRKHGVLLGWGGDYSGKHRKGTRKGWDYGKD